MFQHHRLGGHGDLGVVEHVPLSPDPALALVVWRVPGTPWFAATEGKVVALLDSLAFVDDDAFEFVEEASSLPGGVVVVVSISVPVPIGRHCRLPFSSLAALFPRLGRVGPHVDLKRVLHAALDLLLNHAAGTQLILEAIDLHAEDGGQFADTDGFGHLAGLGAAAAGVGVAAKRFSGGEVFEAGYHGGDGRGRRWSSWFCAGRGFAFLLVGGGSGDQLFLKI